jgi:hypothetical protein
LLRLSLVRSVSSSLGAHSLCTHDASSVALSLVLAQVPKTTRDATVPLTPAAPTRPLPSLVELCDPNFVDSNPDSLPNRMREIFGLGPVSERFRWLGRALVPSVLGHASRTITAWAGGALARRELHAVVFALSDPFCKGFDGALRQAPAQIPCHNGGWVMGGWAFRAGSQADRNLRPAIHQRT